MHTNDLTKTHIQTYNNVLLQYDTRDMYLLGVRARWLTCTCLAWNDGWISRVELTANCAVTTSMLWRHLVIDGEHYIYRVRTRARARFHKPDVIQAPEMHFDLSRTPARFLFRFPPPHPLFSFPRWIVRSFFFYFLPRNLFPCYEPIRL